MHRRAATARGAVGHRQRAELRVGAGHDARRRQTVRARAVDLDATGLSNFQCNWGPWGAFDVPRFYQLGRESCTDQRASTLSLWTDLQSVFNFAYSGLHLSALRKRAEWFKAPAWPTYACWWVEDKEIPTWSQACRKLEQLHDKGSTPQAFNFRQCFDAQGCLTQLERPTTA